MKDTLKDIKKIKSEIKKIKKDIALYKQTIANSKREDIVIELKSWIEEDEQIIKIYENILKLIQEKSVSL